LAAAGGVHAAVGGDPGESVIVEFQEPHNSHGPDNERAALRYQHMSAKADRVIADGLDALVQAEHEQGRDHEDDDGGAAGKLVPVA
jgi:hypothetical protein